MSLYSAQKGDSLQRITDKLVTRGAILCEAYKGQSQMTMILFERIRVKIQLRG